MWNTPAYDSINRRPISFASQWALLADVAEGGSAAALARDEAGGPKIWLIARLLAHRRAHPSCYDRTSGYEPLEVFGPHADRFVAFTRSGQLAVIVPRLVTSKADPWTGTEVALPPGQWVSVLTDEHFSSGKVRAAALLRLFPVQVLARDA